MQLSIANQIEHCSTCNYDNSVCILHVWPPNQEPKRCLTFTRVTTIFRVFYSNHHHHHPRQQQSSKRMTIDGNSVRCDDWWDWINNWINAGHNQQSIASITINTADSKDNNCVCVCTYGNVLNEVLFNYHQQLPSHSIGTMWWKPNEFKANLID